MGLSTIVAVTNINNLSDARYCAGMGADILGFNLIPDQPDYIQPGSLKEIAGWIAGVEIMGQFNRQPIEKVKEIIADCGLQMALLPAAYLVEEIAEIQVPVILQIIITKDTDYAELSDLLKVYKSSVKYFLITSDEFTLIDQTNILFLKSIAQGFPVLIGFGLTKENIVSTLQEIKPAGLVLQGGQEIKPGLKSYDDLEAIFELLEE
jgi:phosphoribosylanthranilate isomerase